MNAYVKGFVENGQKLRRQHRRPPLQKTQGWGTLRRNGAMQRWATRQVKYRFEITSTYSRKSVAGVGVRVDRKWSEGTVVSVDGAMIPQGEYTLHPQGGEILRVDNFDVWSIVPNAA